MLEESVLQEPSLITDEFFTITIKHLPTSEFVIFEGWVTEFSDQFSSNWNKQSVYGRMDPLVTFENTERTITLGFDVVSGDREQAIANLVKINQLIEFLYPMYSKSERSSQTILNAAPLLGIRWTNLISDASAGGYLYGYIQGGVNYAPDMGEGGFIKRKVAREEAVVPESVISALTPIPTPGIGPIVNTSVVQENSFIPKKVGLSFTFNVLHTHLAGWSEDKKFGGAALLNKKFPNASMIRNSTSATTTGTFGNQNTTLDLSLESIVLDGD